MGRQIPKTANNEALSLTGDLQQLALKLYTYFFAKTKFGLIENPIYYTEIHRSVKGELDENPEFRKQFNGAIRFTGYGDYPYSGEVEYMLTYLEAIGKIKMYGGNILFPGRLTLGITSLKLLGPGRK
jgi:hypothetical protein